MKRIHKYSVELLEMSGNLTFDIPLGFKVLSVGTQKGYLCIWVMIDVALLAQLVPVRFRVIGTGHDIEDGFKGEFIGTVSFMCNSLIYHVFEEK